METAYYGILILVTILFIIFSGTYLKWHPFFSLLVSSLGFGLLSGMPVLQVISTLALGFGSLIGAIGLIVVLGSILGVILEESGSVIKLGNVLYQHASKSPSLGIAFLGMVLGIPVFCDSGFIVLISLAKSVAATSGIAFPTMALSLSGGLYTTHTLVPPTPGPVAAAGNLGIGNSLGLVILLGVVVSVPVVIIAHYYAKRIGVQITFTESKATIPVVDRGSSVAYSVVLIVLPIILIAMASVTELMAWHGPWVTAILFLGNPIIALLSTVALGLVFFRSGHNAHAWLERGIRQAGPILILTGCGGALGAVLKASPVTALISEWAQVYSLSGVGFLLMGFLISVLFKTAQGSSTSAIVIVSALLAPLVWQAGFDSSVELSLLVLAIGAGAMTVSHANDSYFWVVSQFSGFDLKSAYKGITVMTFFQGITALGMVLILHWILV